MARLASMCTVGLDLHELWCVAASQGPELCCTMSEGYLGPISPCFSSQATPDWQLGGGPTLVQPGGLRLLVLLPA